MIPTHGHTREGTYAEDVGTGERYGPSSARSDDSLIRRVEALERRVKSRSRGRRHHRSGADIARSGRGSGVKDT